MDSPTPSPGKRPSSYQEQTPPSRERERPVDMVDLSYSEDGSPPHENRRFLNQRINFIETGSSEDSLESAYDEDFLDEPPRIISSPNASLDGSILEETSTVLLHPRDLILLDDDVLYQSAAAGSPPSSPNTSLNESNQIPLGAASVQIPVRRVASTPSKTSQRLRSINSSIFPPRASPSGSIRVPRPSHRNSLTSQLSPKSPSPYAFRRQISLPNASVASKPKSMLRTIDRTNNNGDENSSIGSIDNEEMVQLAKELSIPKRKKSKKIFRIGTPTMFSASARAPSPRGGTPTELESLKLPPLIARNDTNKTDCSDDVELGGLELAKTDDASETENERIRSISPLAALEQEQSPTTREEIPFFRRTLVQLIIYLGTFAVFGATIRVYVGRFFGADCELDNVHDFATPLAKHICVTASGTTEQTGGAFFLDLPANMLGSFIMGLLTTLQQWPPIPWLRSDHPLQNHDSLHVAMKTGMCGSLTT